MTPYLREGGSEVSTAEKLMNAAKKLVADSTNVVEQRLAKATGPMKDELGELKQRTEALKKIRAEREQKVKKLEDQIAASSDAVASLKKNESKLRRAT